MKYRAQRGDKAPTWREQLKKWTTPPQTELGRLRRRLVLQGCVTVLPVLLIASVIFGMTSAWYTNVVKQSAITVQAGAWNFDGSNITVSDSEITAKPGDSGVLPVTIRNPESSGINLRVDASKDHMTAAMQRRVYFYVEETEGEGESAVKKRTYLSGGRGYIYDSIPAGETLELTADSEQPAICWEWVLDVVGYYVYGQVTPRSVTTAEGTPKLVGTLSEDAEYLMPVVYDPMEATYDAEGCLVTTDGDQTAKDFVKDLCTAYGADFVESSYGYIENYYPVDVDMDTYTGVWIVLLTDAEIQDETARDTELGQSGASFTAELLFSIQNAGG